MVTVELELPEPLHAVTLKLADREQLSLERLIVLALSEKLSALMTEDILGERAKSGSKKMFQRAMSKVPAIEPDAEDRLIMQGPLIVK
ncbi:hypothetical protein BH11PLA2_BH11PLA2_37910 [soil metagenome]